MPESLTREQKDTTKQGCQIVYFQNKNPNLGKFWRALEWKMLLYFMTIWNILRPFDITYGRWVQFLAIWYIFPILVCLNLATLQQSVFTRAELVMDDLKLDCARGRIDFCRFEILVTCVASWRKS
jgi:hypothetical protein